MSEILLLNDFVSRGKIAGNMIDPVLSSKNHNVYFLPTALISHNFSLGNVAVLDTNTYIQESLSSWDKLNFKFDVIFIGFIENNEQKDLIINYIKNLSYDPLIILDPIMGDDGSIYPGLSDEKIDIYKDLFNIADIILPNHTEAKLLGINNFNDYINIDKKFVITSIEEDGSAYTLGISEKLHKVYYEKLDAKYAGTGDLFDALFINHYLQNNDFNFSIESTVDQMSKILKIQKSEFEDFDSIFIEAILSRIDGGFNAWKEILS
mgnify:CR=1 FL=1